MTKRTATSPFGVSKRESHDASRFYSRFTAPTLSKDSAVNPSPVVDRLICADARSMSEIADNSVALVVTSPPYFAGKEYEEALGAHGVPGTYLEYLGLLRDVFAECARALEPGGRIAVNVANLGRRPYRSLSADVITILQDDLALLLRGEIVWLKQRGASGSCAWGSFQQPVNPVLRDLTERIIVASKGRFDRAVQPDDRRRIGLPSAGTMTREDFMEGTLDLWELPAESATRIGHPAPFPIELVSRLVNLYTFRGDIVLDPFCGSGTTPVAALRMGRHFVGYELEPAYIQLSETRIQRERLRLASTSGSTAPDGGPEVGQGRGREHGREDCNQTTRAIRDGLPAREIARSVIAESGLAEITPNVRVKSGPEFTFGALGTDGRQWLFDVIGRFTTNRRTSVTLDAAWKAIGKATVAHAIDPALRVVLLTVDLPPKSSAVGKVFARVTGDDAPISGVVGLLDPESELHLRALVDPVP